MMLEERGQGVDACRALAEAARMNGQLNEHPLVELIREIAGTELSGALRLGHERVKVAVYFDAGEIIFAASNLRLHRLAECIRRWGVLTEKELARAGDRASDTELGSALVETGVLSPQSLEELLARQVVDVLRPALLWTYGGWSFDPRVRLAEGVRVKTEIRELLVESARRLPSEFIASRLANGSERLLPAEQAPTGPDLQPTEAFVFSRVDMALSVSELLAVSGLPEADALRAIYALALGGFVRREGWSQAFTPEMIAKAQAVNAKADRMRPAPVPPVAAERPSVEAKVTEEKPVAVVEEGSDELRGVDDLFARLERATNYYQILGISRSAGPDIIKRTYHRLARRFHPDRFHGEADAQLHARVESAFARIAQAYETLKDKQSRATYDLKIEREQGATLAGSGPSSATKQGAPSAHQHGAAGGARTPETPAAEPASHSAVPSRAEESFQKGMAALKQGNRPLAAMLLGEAARLEPGQPRYRAFYGRALAGNSQTRRQAESEIQAAIALDAGNASYRVMLAEFYREIGLPRRAQGELERALSIDPKNDAARQLLDSLRTTK